MRVALNGWFLDQPGTGSGQYIRELLPRLVELAPTHQFLLVCPPSSATERVVPPEVQLRTLRGRFWRSNAGKVLFEQVAFPWYCRQWGAELAHVPYWGSPLVPSVPTVVTIHDLIPMLLAPYRGGSLVRLYTRLVARSARKAAAVLTDSLASQTDIERYLAVEVPVLPVYLAAAPHFAPRPGEDDAAFRQHYGLPDRYVLYLAGHDVRKNVESLLRAYAVVAQAAPDAGLVIGGRLPEPTGRRAFQAPSPFYDPRPLVTELGLERSVRFIGWVDEDHKPALYRGAACAVFVSRYEGFGLPVLEALACGAPLVTSNASSLPELLGDAGFAVDPDDVKGLAGAVLSCLVDEALAAELRRRGPQQAARFSWAQTARETLAAYDTALGSVSGRQSAT